MILVENMTRPIYPIGTRLNFKKITKSRGRQMNVMEDFTGVVIDDYPFFFNILIHGNSGSFIRSINKVDIYSKYYKVNEVV